MASQCEPVIEMMCGDRDGGRVIAYDEFGLLEEQAAELGIAWSGLPAVCRKRVLLPSGLHLSALVWGESDPEIVLVHGGSQSAHTWDAVALALGLPLLALDLPGHGCSDHRPDHDYRPWSMAVDVAVAVEELAPQAQVVAGLSLGGLTAICLAADRPRLVRRLAVLDVTPSVDISKAERIVTFWSGIDRFSSFEEMLARLVEYQPNRSVASLRRSLWHHVRRTEDGRWTWKHDPIRNWRVWDEGECSFEGLWARVEQLTMPVALWRSGFWSVVSDEDAQDWMRRAPHSDQVVVEGAGHAIPGDKPLEVACLLQELMLRS